MMTILNALREKTEVLHRELEKDNLANKILDHSISLEEYKLLLFQNYVAYKSAEVEISRFLIDDAMDKASRLEKDLKTLGVKDLDLELNFSCNNEAEAVGAAYVIEGSAMGGMLIGKELKKCASLEGLPAPSFFSGERNSMAGWNTYLKYLRSRSFNEEEIKAATKKAQETFSLFKEAFSLQLTSC